MELRDYLRVISVRKWIIIQATIVVAGSALIVSFLQRPAYEAQSVLLIKERGGSSGLLGAALPGLSLQPERSLQTHLKLLRMPTHAQRAAHALSDDGNSAAASPVDASKSSRQPTPTEILSELTVDADPQTNLIYVKALDSSSVRAASIANAVATEYVDSNRELNTAEIEKARRELSFRIRDAEEDILTLNKIVANAKPKSGASNETSAATGTSRTTPSKAVRQNAAARLKMALSVYEMLTAKEEELKITKSLEPGEATLMQRAYPPEAPAKPQPVRNGVLGLVLGLSLGLGMAFTVEYLDNTIKDSGDVDRYYSLPLLGQIPANEPNGSSDGDSPLLVMGSGANDVVAEAYRALRTAITYINYDGSLKHILVTSGKPDEGKTSVAANLAVALTHAGYRVVAVDCDLRQPSLHRPLGMLNDKGLTDVLVGRMPLAKAIQQTNLSNLRVIASGETPPNPSELLNSHGMDRVLEACAQEADYVILDSPPILAVTDSAVLAPKTSGVVLCATVGETTREDAERVVDVLSDTRVRLLGVVLNRIPIGPGHSYYYYSAPKHQPQKQ